jgi:serine O-acetyltransferase
MTMTTRAVEPAAWVDPAPHRPVPFWANVRQDVIAHIPPAKRGRSRWGWALATTAVVLRSSGFHATINYRMAHTFYHRGGVAGRVLAGLLFWWNRHFYVCSLAPTARVHGGLILSHPQGIVVGPGAAIGPRAWIFQNATVGGAPGLDGLPQIGTDVRIYAGAVLAGPITIGDNVMIGANAVVYRDVPPRSVVRCPPAEVSPLPAVFIHADEDE